MLLKVAYNKKDGSPSLNTEINSPEVCPVCQTQVLMHNSVQSWVPAKDELQILFICPNPKCKEMVVGHYRSIGDNQFTLSKTEPPNLKADTFPDFVKDISSTFIEVYNQANEAKQRGLTEIAGPGFRKAAEFLLKDYAKSTADPKDHPRIEKLFVGEVVKEFINDARIQAVAKRALWVGNDETHYLRKWESHDINDLINLIRLTVHWMEIEKNSKDYIDQMPDGASGKP